MRTPVQQVRQQLRGVSVGLLTPFDDEHAIEHDKIAENARSLYDSDVRSFLAAANISEYHSLSNEERVAVTKTSVDALPDDACVLAGVGGPIGDAKDLVREYDCVGADAMMVMPPDHTYIHERGLLEYYRQLGSVTDCPLVPYVRGFEPSVDLLADVTHLDQVVGIKYALRDPVRLGEAVEAGADDVVWVNGLAEPFAVSYWAEGVEGFSAGVSNFRPEIGLELFEALAAGDMDRAHALRNACLPYQKFREETGADNTISGAFSVAAVKKGLELAGLHGGEVRTPIQSLSAKQERRAEELYDQLDADIDRLVSS